MAEIELVKHREKREELLGLFQASFGLTVTAELWNWKYFQNPLAPAVPELIVATDRGRIVGARPFLLAELWLGNERVKAAQPCDTMVHPQYRQEGIFSRMNQFAIEYFRREGYALFYNFPNSNSRPGYLRQGWEIVAITETLYRFDNPQKVISYKLRNKFLGTGLGFFYDKLLNARIKASPLSSSFQIEVFDQFADELKEVDTLSDKSAINLARGETYLRWRFDQHPEHSYKYIVVRKKGELWGYAVVSVQEQLNGLIYGMIVDYLVKDKDIDCFRLLINECLIELKNSECDFISIWAFSQPEFRRELIKLCGFKSSSRFPYNRFLGEGHFVAREVDEQVLEKIDIYNKENWRVTCIYPDTT